MSSRFNTDTGALNTRADLNASRARYDLEDWMLQFLPDLKGRRIVDLGCGSGKQVMRFAPLVGAEGSVLGLDASREAVAEVEAKAAAAGYAQVSAAQVRLDDVLAYLEERDFDLVTSSYAIYYASDFVGLMSALAGRIGSRGEVFVCGPGAGTNREMSDIIAGLAPEAAYVADFIDEAGLAALSEAYAECETFRLDNAISFRSAEEVMAWWRNHNSYDPLLESRVRETLGEAFERSDRWEMTKSVLGVRCRV